MVTFYHLAFSLDSFMYCSGPLFIFSSIFCFIPFMFSTHWKDADAKDPIKLGVKSLPYLAVVIAAVAASTPPLLELLVEIIYSKGKPNKRSTLTFCILSSLILPEIIALIFICQTSNTKLYICLRYARINATLFFGTILLCETGKKFWCTKWCTFAVSFIYVASMVLVTLPYFSLKLQANIQKAGSICQVIGLITFISLSIRYLTKNTSKVSTDDFITADEFICRFSVICTVIVIIGMFILIMAKGLPIWTNFDEVYLTTFSVIFFCPNIAICIALTHASRNEVFIMQQVKQMFVRYISHEMRTPLNTAVMGLQFLRSELMKTDVKPELVNIIDEVKGACEISVTILNEMLDYDKLQSGIMKLEIEEIPVKEFFVTTLSPFYVQAHAKDIGFTCNLDHPQLEALLIDADRNKFAQVIRNLISNALKFTPAGGIVDVVMTVQEDQNPPEANNTTTTTTTAFTTTAMPSYILRVDVVDSGVGVSEENQQKLFKEIVQFNPAKLQSGGGSGLGLYSIMDLHKGSLTVSSRGEGYGSTFSTTVKAKYEKFVRNEAKTLLVPEDEEGSITGYTRNSLFSFSSLKSRDSAKILPRNASAGVRYITTAASSCSISGGATGSTTAATVGDGDINRRHPPTNYLECKSFSDNDECSLLKVLVVDDSTSNRKMLMRLLRDKCSSIAEAVDGVDAVEKIRTIMGNTNNTDVKDYYDAVLMDFVMPNMDGPEAAKCMRELGYMGIIIGITGNVMASDRDWYISHGANIVLTKPVDIKDIERAFKLIEKFN